MGFKPMTVRSTTLFERPQQEIASLITGKMEEASRTSIVTGFATPGGIGAIANSIRRRPRSLSTFVIGAATYPGFEALDQLLSAGVQPDSLRVHLGHTNRTDGKKNPYARFHPMMHSKIYYMETEDSVACAFIGSHNVTSFALTGLNGEASVLLEGPADATQFEMVRQHIATVQRQSVQYSVGMKEAYAWWTREFIDGLRGEIKIPTDWSSTRTILLFAEAGNDVRPAVGNTIYFEIPAGIEQIESLRTEAHLFLFDTLPRDPWQAIHGASQSSARYLCKIIGAENNQGNLEVACDWRIETGPRPSLRNVPSSILRPQTAAGLQQVRARVELIDVDPYDYLFEREKVGWDPEFSPDERLEFFDQDAHKATQLEALGNNRVLSGWRLVTGLVPRVGEAKERDEAALKLAAPESGSFILVSLRRRRKDKAL
jgi:hypothetical protein